MRRWSLSVPEVISYSESSKNKSVFLFVLNKCWWWWCWGDVPLHAQSGGSFLGKRPLLHHAPPRKWVMSLRLWDYRPSGRRVPGCFLAVMFRPCSAHHPPPPCSVNTHTHTRAPSCAVSAHFITARQHLRNGNSKCTRCFKLCFFLFFFLKSVKSICDLYFSLHKWDLIYWLSKSSGIMTSNVTSWWMLAFKYVCLWQ